MIAFKNYNYYYNKKKPLFKGLNFNLEQGKIYGLFGKNGSGKSTLLKSIVGLNFPKEGSVEAMGVFPKDRSPNYLNQLSYLPDKIYIPKLKVNVIIKLYGVYYPNFSETQFYDYLSKFEVSAEVEPHKMSFGQQKKFMIAFVLACNAPLIIMDEPTNGLDIPSKKQFRKIVASAISDETTVIISTHSARDLEKMFDHVLLINEGELLVNKEVYTIMEKLNINLYTTKPEHNNYLICEEVVGGYKVIQENKYNENSDMEMELFFNACIANPNRIKQILN